MNVVIEPTSARAVNINELLPVRYFFADLSENRVNVARCSCPYEPVFTFKRKFFALELDVKDSFCLCRFKLALGICLLRPHYRYQVRNAFCFFKSILARLRGSDFFNHSKIFCDIALRRSLRGDNVGNFRRYLAHYARHENFVGLAHKHLNDRTLRRGNQIRCRLVDDTLCREVRQQCAKGYRHEQ